MKNSVKPIRTKKNYETALAELERLWGAKSGTPEGDRLEVLATLIDAYEACTFRWNLPIRSKRSSSEWSSRASPAKIWNL
jgi:HTH-type transcriptional regulator/antitoxin HigA